MQGFYGTEQSRQNEIEDPLVLVGHVHYFLPSMEIQCEKIVPMHICLTSKTSDPESF